MKQIKIAKIISTTALVINAGSEEGVKLNQKYGILDENGVGETVYDPDTQKSLGTLDDFKGKVIITQVYDHMAVAQSEPISLNFDVKKDLNVNKSQITGYARKNNLIKIGDVVKLLR